MQSGVRHQCGSRIAASCSLYDGLVIRPAVGPSSNQCARDRCTDRAAAGCSLHSSYVHRHHQQRLQPCAASSTAWRKEDFAEMNAQLEADTEAEVGNEWRAYFEEDPTLLYQYADRDEAEWAQVLQQLERLPKSQWEDSELPTDAVSFSPALCNQFISMGTWRLRNALSPVITYLASRIEGTWREAFVDDLNLYPTDKWKAQYDICDSMDPDRQLDGWSYGDIPFPEKGQEGYPRMLIENRVYCSRVFRKLHIELALRQDGLQVLHMVMYPRYAVDIPILAVDIVVSKGEVTLAIIDACPVRKNKQLPAHYLQTMLELQEELLTDSENQRRIPEWGQNIFSPACVCIRPQSPADLAGFLRYAVSLHRAHCLLATLVSPLDPNDARQRQRIAELLEGHKRFVDNQLANKKTSRVLEAAFGQAWSDAYMRTMMFDYCPDDEPEWEDASLVNLFNHFEENPELGSRKRDMDNTNDQAAIQRAEEVLQALVDGAEVRQDNVDKALQALFVHDKEFQENCITLLPRLATMPKEEVGAYLSEHLEELGLGTPVKRWTGAKALPGQVTDDVTS